VEKVGNAPEVFAIFLRLGLTSFGGPIAHIAYFRQEFVQKRRWLDEDTFAQVVALCQFLPGPASSQVGIIIGYQRAGLMGSLAAWCGFTLPSAIALVAFAYAVYALPRVANLGWVHGLLVAAVAVVAVAVANMASTLTPDSTRRTVAIAAAIASLLLPVGGFSQLILVVLGAAFGWLFLKHGASSEAAREISASMGRHIRSGNPRLAIGCAIVFLSLIVGLPFFEPRMSGSLLAFSKFFEVGGLVFGGGHVVLPLLQAEVVPAGWISNTSFLAGYGAAQAVPGPLFTFAAYLGAAMVKGPVHGIWGALVCLLGIFAPSFLLIAAVLPFWQRVVENPATGSALQGVNAVVVGILLAALYNPVWVTAVHSAYDVALVLAALLGLTIWRVPPWAVVVGSAVIANFVYR
jgi:chromate transporter